MNAPPTLEEPALARGDTPARPARAPRKQGPFVGSIVWLTFEKILRSLGSVSVGLLVARFLGPDDYGRLGVALGLASVGREVVSLALERIIRRDLAANTDPAGVIFGTYLYTAFVVSLLTIGGLSLFAIGTIADAPTSALTLLLVWMTLPQILTAADWWFESHCQARPMVIARNIIWLAGMALKVAFVLAGAGVFMFALLALAEWTLSALVVWRAFRARQADSFRLVWRGSLLARWMRENWSVLFVVVISVLGERLLAYITQHAAGNESAGHFGAAQRLIEAWWALFIMLSGVILPRMTLLQNQGRDRFQKFTQTYFDLSFGLALVAALAGTAVAQFFVPLLLGESYRGAVPVIIAMLWAAPAGFVFLARVQYSTAIRKITLDFPSSIVNACATLALSIWWAPRHGAAGVAWAATCALWLGVYGVPLVWPRLRKVHPHQWRALLFFTRLSALARLMLDLASRGRKEVWH